MRYLMMMIAAVACPLAFFQANLAQASLIQNGTFENGNALFASDLTFSSSFPLNDGQYTIWTNPADTFPGWSNMGDHTTGSGLMLIATPSPGTDRTWFQSIMVNTGENYIFSGWAAHVTNENPAILSINIDAVSLGTLTLPDQAGQWIPFSFSYNATSSGAVTLSITDLQTTDEGNDFALDDLSFSSTSMVPEPDSLVLSSLGFGVMALLSVLRRFLWNQPGRALAMKLSV